MMSKVVERRWEKDACLALSHRDLPDPRVEKAAISASKWERIFR